MAVIILSGMIGAGKTTLTTQLSELLGSTPYYEPVGDNPVLDLFYQDREKYGYLLQTFFLSRRFKMIKKALSHKNNVLDRSIYEDAYFTQINHNDGAINDVEYSTYLELLENMMEEIDGMEKKAPDLMIYLNADFDTILAHIKKRGRAFEQVDGENKDTGLVDYYKKLYDGYYKWYDEYDKSPKMMVNVHEHDLSTPSGRKYTLGLILDKLVAIGQLTPEEAVSFQEKI